MFCQNTLSPHLCVSQLYTLHLSNSEFLSLFTALSFFLWVSASLTVSLCRSMSFLRELFWMSLLSVSMLAKITKSHSTGRPCQEDSEEEVFTACVFVKESMH